MTRKECAKIIYWKMQTNIYIEWLNNKGLLYSRGNYIQYPVISHNEEEYKKECTYIAKSLCCTVEIHIVNQLYLIKNIYIHIFVKSFFHLFVH